MNDLNDRYKELAGWDPYVKELKDRLADEEPARILRQVGSRAGQSFRLRGPGYSAYDRSTRLIIRRETPAQHSLRQVALFRRLMYKQYADRDAREEPEASNPKAYAALRLKRISQHMGAREQSSGQVMAAPRWTLVGVVKQVLDVGDRTPATTGKVLGLVDWFHHCLAAFEQVEQTNQTDKAKHEEPAQRPLQREQSAGVKFRNGFTLADADKIALEVELIDMDGNYSGVRGKRASRLCGFYWGLRKQKKVEGSLEALRDFFASRYLKERITSKPNMNLTAAGDMAADVENALKQHFPTAIPG